MLTNAVIFANIKTSSVNKELNQMQTKTYVTGYYRNDNKEDKNRNPNTDGSVVIAAGLLGSSVLMLSIVHWKITLSITIAAVVFYLVRRATKHQQLLKNRPSLTVNELGKKKIVYL